MRLPRDISGTQLARVLEGLGYKITRQTGSHMRLTTLQHGQHHITVPAHDSLRMGTLIAVLNEVAAHFKIQRKDLIEQLFK